MASSPNKLIPSTFTPVPALAVVTDVHAVADLDAPLDAEGFLVASDQPLPAVLALNWDEVQAAGFDGSVGSSLLIPRSPAPLALIGIGASAEVTTDSLRDAAAAAARVTARKASRLGGWPCVWGWPLWPYGPAGPSGCLCPPTIWPASRAGGMRPNRPK